MPTYVSAGDSKAWEPAPEGLWPVVCVDVVDKGEQPTQWGPKRKVQLRWQLGEEAGVRDDGKPWLVTRTFTASLFKLAELSKLLVRWRGKQFTDEELEQFDLDNVIGAPGLANIVHNATDDGRVFANVDTIVPLPKTMKRPVIRDYIRQQDREPQPTFHNGTPQERQMDDAFAGTVKDTPAKPQAMPAASQPHDDGLNEIADELFAESSPNLMTEAEFIAFCKASKLDTKAKVCARLGIASWSILAGIGYGNAASRLADMYAAQE